MKVLLSFSMLFALLAALWRQGNAVGCSEGDPEATCLPFIACSTLTDVLSLLPVADFISLYSCGVDPRGNVLLCCPSVPVPLDPGTLNSPITTARSPAIKEAPSRQGIDITCRSDDSLDFTATVVSVGHTDLESREFVSSCTGVILSVYWILTSAQCVTSLKALPHVMPFSQINEAVPKLLETESVTISQLFNSNTLSHNVGLVKLRWPIDFREVYARPVCLPTERSSNSSPLIGVNVGIETDHGVGVVLLRPSSGKKKVSVSVKTPLGVRSKERCERENFLRREWTRASDHLCIQGFFSQYDPFDPMILQEIGNTKHYTVVGVGGKAINPLLSGVTSFTSVFDNLPWIRDTTKLFPA